MMYEEKIDWYSCISFEYSNQIEMSMAEHWKGSNNWLRIVNNTLIMY